MKIILPEKEIESEININMVWETNNKILYKNYKVNYLIIRNLEFNNILNV